MRHSIAFLIVVTLSTVTAGFAQSQTAEDTYREARRALNRREFTGAVSGFETLRANYPASEYVADSYYWQALALERNGDLERTVQIIDIQLAEYPEASTIDDARVLRLQVCGELAQRGDAACAESISTTMRTPGALDEATRLAAVNALINMRPERAIPIARRLLENRDQPVSVRKQALFIVADQADDDEARDVLLSIATDVDDDIEVRAQAVFWLSEVPGVETLSALTQLMEGPGNRQIKDRAIFAIAQHDSPQSMSLLRQFAVNEELDIAARKQAIFWLGEEGEEQSLPFLMELYDDLASVELKKQVMFAVAETEAVGAIDWLLSRAQDTDESINVRNQALFWAADAGISVAELRSLYDSFAERRIRQHLIWLIADHDDEGSLETLLEIAQTDPEPDLREKAIFWLGDSDDPRAEEFLLRLLGE